MTRGKGQAIVLVASGQDNTTRVTVPLVSFSGLDAAKSAEQYFNTLNSSKLPACFFSFIFDTAIGESSCL
jgi:hypothetical protein